MRTAERTTASRLGSYEILHKLAIGGMAELYLARSVGPENFEKLVVLKRILPSLAENETFVRLFLDEARLAAGLDHPCIAHVYDLGRVEGGYFFTMEYVHGRDVRSVINHSLLDGRPWPIEQTVHVASSIAAALHYAHEHCGPNGQPLGIVHRDVSPSNIMVTYEGAVKLLDFGVAKITSRTTKTRTGSLKGKVAYMSPEQAKGADIDRRSDIFSLGIVLWEMLAMRRLFKAANDLATLQLIINKTPGAPSQHRADCPAELDRIVLRALATDPDNRYQSAQELQLDLENLAREHRFNQSSITLARNMNALFGREIEAWKRARGTGVALADHIIAWSAETEPTPTSDFVVDDEPASAQSSSVDPDDEKTEQTQPPVAVAARRAPTPAPTPALTPAVGPASAKRKKNRIRDYAIVKEPSVVIEPGLDAPPDPPPVAVVAPDVNVAVPIASSIARASSPVVAEPVAPLPAARPVIRSAVPVPVVAVAEPTQAIRIRQPRSSSRVGIVVGALGTVAAAAIAFVVLTRDSNKATHPSAPSESAPTASETPSPPPPSPSPSPPPPSSPPPSSPPPSATPAPASPPPVIAGSIPSGPTKPQRTKPSVKATASVRHRPAKTDSAKTDSAKTEVDAPKTAPKFDPTAALPPM